MLSFPTCVCHSMLSVWSRPSSATWNSIKRWICTTYFSILLSAGIVLFLALHFYKQHCPIFVQEPSGLEVLWVTYLPVELLGHCELSLSPLFWSFQIVSHVGHCSWNVRSFSVCEIHEVPLSCSSSPAALSVEARAQRGSAGMWWVSNTIGLDCRLFKGKGWMLHLFLIFLALGSRFDTE